MPSHQCLVLKKPSPLATKPWRSVEKKLQKRWLVTRGNHVDYYTHPKPAKARPKGYFDLRSVTTMRPAREGDPTAPEYAVEIVASKHHIVLDFEYRAQRDACLQIWVSAAPAAALPDEWQKKASDDLKKQLGGAAQSMHVTAVDDDEEGAATSSDSLRHEYDAVEPPPAPPPPPGAPPSAAAHSHAREERIVKRGPLSFFLIDDHGSSSSSSGGGGGSGSAPAAWRVAHARLTSHATLRLYESEEAADSAERFHNLLAVLPLSGCRLFVPKIQRGDEAHAFRVLLDTKHSASKLKSAQKCLLAGSTAEESDDWRHTIMRYAGTASSSKGELREHPAKAGGGGGAAAAAAGGAAGAAAANTTAMPPPPPLLSSSASTPVAKKKRVLVLGSSGNLAQATLHWLVEKHIDECEILAGTRDVSRFVKRKGVVPIEAHMTSPQESWLSNLDVLLLVTPNNEQRVPATIKAAKAAVDAKVPHLIVISIATAEVKNAFGDQFKQIEDTLKEMCSASGGIGGKTKEKTRFTIVRLPLFLENYYGFEGGIKSNGTIKCSMDPSQSYTPIAVNDIGEAIASVAADSNGRFLDRTITLAGEPHTFAQVCEWLSVSCGGKIVYERVTPQQDRETLLSFGLLPFQVEGIVELYNLVSEGRYVFSMADTLECLGHRPHCTKEWLVKAAPSFMPIGGQAPQEMSSRSEEESMRSEPQEEDMSSRTEAEEATEQQREAKPSLDALLGSEREEPDELSSRSVESAAVDVTDAAEPAPPAQKTRQRQPTIVLMEDMEELWHEVFDLEQAGKFEEAASHQEARIEAAHKKYEEAKATYGMGFDE